MRLYASEAQRKQDTSANLLKDVCDDVGFESKLRPLAGESFAVGARLDIKANKQSMGEAFEKNENFEPRIIEVV